MKPAFIPVVITPPDRRQHSYIKELEDPANKNYNADIILDEIFDDDGDQKEFYYLTTQVKYLTIYNKFNRIYQILTQIFTDWYKIEKFKKIEEYNKFVVWVNKEIEYFIMLNRNSELITIDQVKFTEDNQDMYLSIERALNSAITYNKRIHEKISAIQHFIKEVERIKEIKTQHELQKSEEENQRKRNTINELIYRHLINHDYQDKFYRLIDTKRTNETKIFSDFLIERITSSIDESDYNKKYIPIIKEIIKRHILEISWKCYMKRGGWMWGWGDLKNPLKIELKRRYDENYGNPEFDFTSGFQKEIIHLGGNKNNNKHKSRKHKSRKHKSRKHKSRKYKSRKHKKRKQNKTKHKKRKH